MPWLHDGHVIGLYVQWSRDPDIKSSFASNQTSNIFNPKILYVLFSASDLSYYRAPHCCFSQLPHTNSNTTFYTSALVFSGAEVLHVFQSRCLIAGLREKTTYRSAPFPSGGGRARDVLQRKATGEATSKVVRSWLAGCSQAWLSGRQHQLLRSILSGGRGKRSRRDSRWSSGFMRMNSDGWLDVSTWFISWMKLRLGPLGLQKG